MTGSTTETIIATALSTVGSVANSTLTTIFGIVAGLIALGFAYTRVKRYIARKG